MRVPWIARILVSRPDAKLQSESSPCQRSEIRCPTPRVVSCMMITTVSKSLEEVAREIARIQGQPAGKERTAGPAAQAGHCTLQKSACMVFLNYDTALCARWSTIQCGEVDSWQRHSWSEKLWEPSRRGGVIKSRLGGSSRGTRAPASFGNNVKFGGVLFTCVNDCVIQKVSTTRAQCSAYDARRSGNDCAGEVGPAQTA